MKKAKKDDEGYYCVSGFIAVALTIGIHYLFLSNMNFHTTIHVTISLLIFLLISGISSSLLAKVWNKF